VNAPAGEVYRLLADERNWPRIFTGFVHTENLGPADPYDRIGMWAHSEGAVEHWMALRRLDEQGLRIEFRPETPPPGLASMVRSWVVEPVSAGDCLVGLEHAFQPLDGASTTVEEVSRTAARIALAEVEAVRAAAELVAAEPAALVTVEDAVTVAAPADRVFTALFDAARWPLFMEHVRRAEVTAAGEDGHILELETLERHGGTFTTRAVRVGLPGRTVAYKQLLLPPLGHSHHVRWRLTEHGGSTEVRSEQTVVIKAAGVPAVLGEGAGISQARGFVRSELSSKVRLILDAVRRHVEQDAKRTPNT
jgi:aromatase